MPSPFPAKGKGSVKWPGGIVAHSDIPEGPVESDLRKRAAMSVSTSALTPRASAAPMGHSIAPNPAISNLQQQTQHRTPGPDKSIFSATGLSASTAYVDKLPPETSKLLLR